VIATREITIVDAALKRKLEQAEAIIEAQKTLARLLDSRKSDAR